MSVEGGRGGAALHSDAAFQQEMSENTDCPSELRTEERPGKTNDREFIRSWERNSPKGNNQCKPQSGAGTAKHSHGAGIAQEEMKRARFSIRSFFRVP